MMWDLLHLTGYLVLIIYAGVVYSVVENIGDSYKNLTGKHTFWMVSIFNVSLLIQATMFIYLQMDWIQSNYDSVIADTSAQLWAVYDWSNGVALLAYSRVLNIWINWDKLSNWR